MNTYKFYEVSEWRRFCSRVPKTFLQHLPGFRENGIEEEIRIDKTIDKFTSVDHDNLMVWYADDISELEVEIKNKQERLLLLQELQEKLRDTDTIRGAFDIIVNHQPQT